MIRIVLLFFALCLSLSNSLVAQETDRYSSTVIDQEILTLDFSLAKESLNRFIRQNKISLISQNEGKSRLVFNLRMDSSDYQLFDTLVAGLGYSVRKNVKTVSNDQKVREVELELNYLRKKRGDYQKIMKKLDPKVESSMGLWKEKMNVDERIFQKEKELVALSKKANVFEVNLEVNDETTSPQNSKVSFVNMPGMEYSYWIPESPAWGISTTAYQGFFLKYLFTRGKSYGLLGVYKSTNLSESDSSTFTDLFSAGFGQDFYSRYLGRGSRKYLNLYSGYNLGLMFASGSSRKTEIFYLAPSIGIEWYKNKYVLLDSKAAYLVPFSYNLQLRGWTFNTSFNFVF